MGSVSEQIVVIKVPSIPFGAIPRPPIKPHLTSKKNFDVFTAADHQLGDEIVIDRTVHAGRESWEGVSIGKNITKELEAKERPATERDVFEILNAKPILTSLENVEVKGIEDNTHNVKTKKKGGVKSGTSNARRKCAK